MASQYPVSSDSQEVQAKWPGVLKVAIELAARIADAIKCNLDDPKAQLRVNGHVVEFHGGADVSAVVNVLLESPAGRLLHHATRVAVLELAILQPEIRPKHREVFMQFLAMQEAKEAIAIWRSGRIQPQPVCIGNLIVSTWRWRSADEADQDHASTEPA